MHGSMVPAFDTSRPSHFGLAGQTTSIGPWVGSHDDR
ncbi:hypothetical protein A4X13_0g7373, partial [Tilletia indica]